VRNLREAQPAGRRLLGATCADLYGIFKDRYAENRITIEWTEAIIAYDTGTSDYGDIVVKWLAPPSTGSQVNVWLTKTLRGIRSEIRCLKHYGYCDGDQKNCHSYLGRNRKIRRKFVLRDYGGKALLDLPVIFKVSPWGFFSQLL
jgi:hypothetical protein